MKKTHLVLSRRVGEAVEIQSAEETVVVIVEAITGRQVRLSFEASPVIGIWRQELLDEEEPEEVEQR